MSFTRALVAVFSAWFVLAIAISETPTIVLPEDDGFISNEQVQWWYWTGHLTTDAGARYGFEVCWFLVLGVDQLVQVAVTDVDKNAFVYTEDFSVTSPNVQSDSFSFSSGQITTSGGNGTDRLFSVVGGYKLDLSLQATKIPVMHYNASKHDYSFGGYTYYYSRTSMQSAGTLTIGDVSHSVTGTSWFDRQYGDLQQAVLQGWQWFAIELQDGRDVMLFDFLGDESEKYGSITSAGDTDVLTASDFEVKVLSYWTSPTTGCTYPSSWQVTFQEQTFTVVPLVENQELAVRDSPIYWEGACSVTGEQGQGKAYVELNGYCPKTGGK